MSERAAYSTTKRAAYSTTISILSVGIISLFNYYLLTESVLKSGHNFHAELSIT